MDGPDLANILSASFGQPLSPSMNLLIIRIVGDEASLALGIRGHPTAHNRSGAPTQSNNE